MVEGGKTRLGWLLSSLTANLAQGLLHWRRVYHATAAPNSWMGCLYERKRRTWPRDQARAVLLLRKQPRMPSVIKNCQLMPGQSDPIHAWTNCLSSVRLEEG